MKNKAIIFLGLILCSIVSYAQEVTGFILPDNGSDIDEIHLLKVDKDGQLLKTIDKAPLDENGYFSFSKASLEIGNFVLRTKLPSTNNLLPQADSFQCSVPIFLLKNEAQLDFTLDDCLSRNLAYNQAAYAEWQKFARFENRSLLTADEKDVRRSTRKYLQDSLEILLVKLFGTKSLQNKALLSLDISENPGYYQALLEELQESDLPSSYYQFLTSEILKMENEALNSQVVQAKTLNYILGSALFVAVLGLLFKVFQDRKSIVADLSIQERKIVDLILEGKSNKEIGQKLFISISTVKTHVSNIYQKTGVRNRQELFQRMS